MDVKVLLLLFILFAGCESKRGESLLQKEPSFVIADSTEWARSELKIDTIHKTEHPRQPIGKLTPVVAPIIYIGYCEPIPNPPDGSPILFQNLEKDVFYEGKVCIDYKEFYGHSPYNIPFVANIFGDVKELYVDDKKIKFTGEGEVFFRQKVYLEQGYNRIPVKVVGKSGMSRLGYIEVTISPIGN
jgi:hypothetical protein